MQIINYTVSALVLIFVVLLFLRAALPHTEAPLADGKELPPEELEFKISVLAMNSTTFSPRGGGVGIRGAARTIRRFYGRMRREAYGRADDFERAMLSARRDIDEAIAEVESRSSKFFALPHKGGHPRIYTLCALMISGSGGYISLDDIRRAVEITNRHSPLGIEELQAAEYMLKACYLERLAFLVEKSLSEKKLKKRAERDSERERVNLSMLKFGAYVSAYNACVEYDSSRKFAALCLENGVDVRSVCRAVETEKAKQAASAAAAICGINELKERFSAETVLGLYGAYGYFDEKCAGFSSLSAERRLAHIDAFARLCRRKKEDETASARSAAGENLYSALEREMPSGYVLGGAVAAAFLLGAIPAVAVSVAKGGIFVIASVLSLPVTLAAVFRLLGRFSRVKAEQMGWTASRATSALSEFSADYAAEAMPTLNKTKTGASNIDTYLSVVASISKVLEAIAPFFAIALAIVAPLLSAYWLIAVFSREIASFAADVRDALSGKAVKAKAALSEIVSAARLPREAAKNLFGLFRKDVALVSNIVVPVAVSAALAVMTAVTGGSIVFYAAAAAFALSPLFGNISVRSEPKVSAAPIACEESSRSYDDYGVLPAVAFVDCGDYLCMSSERGGGRDVYRGSLLFKEMNIYVKDGGGKYVPFTFVPPFLSGGGKTVNNALCVGNTFSVETSGFEGGKKVTVTAHGGGDFEIACVHLTAARCVASEDNAGIVKSMGEKTLYVSAAADTNGTVSLNRGGIFCRGDFEKSSVLAVEARTRAGKVTFAICCDADKTALAQKAECLFRDGFFMRGAAFVSALSRSSLFTPAVNDLASFALYGRCSYDVALERYADVRFPSVVCVLRGENGLGRLRRRLKRLSAVRALGIPFNTVVVCFDGSGHFFKLKDRISLMFTEYGLDANGQAVCLDCAENRALYEKIVSVCPKDEDIRRATRLPCPQVRSFKRTALPIERPKLAACGDCGGVSESGEGIYDPSVCAGAENIVVSDGFGFTARADATSATFDDECILTGAPDSLCRLPAESVTLGENGRVWGFAEEGVSFCAHGGGYSRFVCTDGGLRSEMKVRLSGGAKVYSVSVSNPRKSARKVRVMLSVRPVIGESFENTRHVLELDESEHGVFARNRLSGKRLFAETDAENFERALSAESITDENGAICRVENISGGGVSPALVLSAELKVKPGLCASVNFALSSCGGFDFGSLDRSCAPLRSSFVSGERKLDIFASALEKQAETSLEYADPAGDGYAEKLLKCAALLPTSHEKMRRLIFAACDNRFANGDILLTRRKNRGERASRSGASLMLPMAVARYIDCTDDRDILFERRRYLESTDRRSCRSSGKAASVLEHCLEALFAIDGGGLTPCLGIDSRLVALRALGAFMPLVRDGKTRMLLAEIKTRLSEEVRKLDTAELSAGDLSWLSLVGEGEPSVNALIRRAENASVAELIWLSAALLERGEADAAYSLFERLNPIERRGDTPFMSSEDGLSPDLGIAPSLAYMLLTEGFYGCKTRGETVVFSPSLPKKIGGAVITYRDEKSDFEVAVDNGGSGKWRLFVDGISYNSMSLKKVAALSDKSVELKRR